MDDHALYVSNYFTDTSVPITAIASVGAWWTNPEIVIVHLRAKTFIQTGVIVIETGVVDSGLATASRPGMTAQELS